MTEEQPNSERIQKLTALARMAWPDRPLEVRCAEVHLLVNGEVWEVIETDDEEEVCYLRASSLDGLEAALLVESGETSLRAIERASLPRTREAETVICSAIRLSDGTVFRGHRHGDVMRTVIEYVDFKEPGSWEARWRETHEQGFITSRNRYVDREEGLRLQKAAGIESACRSGYRARQLFSEDLY